MDKGTKADEVDSWQDFPGATQPNTSGRNSRARWFQLLAIVLLVCLIGGGFVVIQVLRAPRPTPIFTIQHGQGWCVSQGSGLSVNNGTPNLNSITAVSSTDAWVVGNAADQPIIEHWNGTFWRTVTTPQLDSAKNALYGVAALSTSDVWAVGTVAQGIGLPGVTFSGGPEIGTQPLIEHWNGQQWSIVPGSAINPSLFSGLVSISAAAPDDIWAVGATATHADNPSFSPLIEHWNGSLWSAVNLPAALSGSVPISVTAITAQNVWIAGNDESNPAQRQPLLAHWDGTHWSTVAGVDVGNQGGQLTSISADAANDMWAVGLTNLHTTLGTPLIEHWDGTHWSRVANPASSAANYFLAILAVSPESVWMVGNTTPNAQSVASAPLIEHWNGQKWTIVQQQKQENGSLSSLTFAGKTIWAIGNSVTGLQQIPNPLIETNC